MPWDVDRAIKHLKSHAGQHSTGQCARYVREAIEAGGVVLFRHNSAKDYGSSLEKVGFVAIASGAGYTHRAGDVGIVQPISGHPHGHMAMYDGTYWVSDYTQPNGLYPGSSYKAAKPSYTIYRYPMVWAGPDFAGQAMAFA